ncbi:MAG: pilus assembly protein PilM [Candidatus Latescibacter sp.]|nr:pilus assembly protein PilM [Candidatus Latescibacter sp.]
MAKGIGIRYSMKGLRALETERSESGLSITRIAAAPIHEDAGSFLARHGFEADTPVAVSLGPGDFLSVYMIREENMDDKDMESHLKWEVQQKMISEQFEYNYDFVAGNSAAYMFAGRKALINSLKNLFSQVITDVEPVALLNGCEGAGEIDLETHHGVSLLISTEAEGISSIVLHDGNPAAVESFPLQLSEYAEKMPGLDFDGSEKNDSENSRQFVKYIGSSVNRLTSRGEDKKKPTPQRLILAGGGVYLDDLAEQIEREIGISTSVSNPFRSLKVDFAVEKSPLESFGAAFTTCFGLALRAMEG